MRLQRHRVPDEGQGSLSIVARGTSSPPPHNVLVCGNPGPEAYLFPVAHNAVRVSSDSVTELEQLRILLERHSPALVIFTRASLDRLVSSPLDSRIAMAVAGPTGKPLRPLSPENAQLLRLVAKGLRNPEIEQATGMKRRTVRAHLSDLFRQFEVTNRTELVGVLVEIADSAYLTTVE